MLTAFFTAPASFACGGDGGGEQSSGARKKPKTKKTKPKKKAGNAKQISTASFLGMSGSELKGLRDSKIGFQIGGYGISLSIRILEMAIYDRRNTRALVKDMSKLDKIKDGQARRKAQIIRLDKEHKRMDANETSQRAVVKRLKKDSGSDFDRLLRKKNPNATDKALKVEKTRQKAIKKYIKDVDWWKRNL